MGHRVGMAIVCLHISALLYLLVGVMMFLLVDDQRFAIGMFIFCVALILGIQFVANWLKRRRFWAWVAGLCIFAVYTPSLFFPLGALGLWGLLDGGSRAEFGVGMGQHRI